MAKTTTDLLNNIKRRAQLPDDGGTLSDTDILAFASDELQNVVAPRLIALNEWQYAFTYNETVTAVREYRINSRCAGNSIISVEYTDDGGVTTRYIQLRHPLMQTNPSVAAENHSIYGNKIVLSTGMPTSGVLRIRALLRPSSLVTTGCASIAAVPAGAVFQVDSSSGFSATQLVDVVYGTSPYEVAQIATVSSIPDGTHITLTSTNDASAAIGTTSNPGRICPAETSDRVMLPDELHDYLAQRVAMRCVEARGLKQDLDNHSRKLADMETAFDRLTSPRSRGEFKAILPEEFFFAGRP